jgi:uncharacterized protein
MSPTNRVVTADKVTIHVTVAWATPTEAHSIALSVPAESSIDAALAAAREIAARDAIPLPDFESLSVGIWGRVRSRGTRLREGDRIELYRPLQADPKDARRARVNAANPQRRGKM